MGLRQKWEEAAAAKNQTDVDPEDIDFLDGAALDDDHYDFGDDDDVNEKTNARRVSMPSLDDMGERYNGRVVSRKGLGLEHGNADDGGEDDSDFDLIDDYMKRTEQFGSDDDDHEVEDADDDEVGHAGTSEQAEQLEKLDAEDSAAMFRKRSCESEELAKAKCVQAQRKLWDATLDIRIRLQQAMHHGNSLRPREAPTASACGNSALRTVVTDVLDELLGMQDDLLAQDPQSVNVPSHSRKRKKSSSYWSVLEEREAKLKAKQDETIEVWNNRIQLQAGARTLTRKSFKALNRSVLTQINETLQSMPSLVRRSQVQRTKLAGAEPTPDDYDEEIYDDSDFYHSLLKELIASGNSTVGAELGVAKRGTSRRKKVDRRASKGRKIRYTIMPKLVNFMAPDRVDDDEFPAVDKLYTNLFGQADSRTSNVQ